jgi:hypothetical protein
MVVDAHTIVSALTGRIDRRHSGIERHRMDSSALYVMFFFFGASNPIGKSDNLAVDVCRTPPPSIAQSEQAKGAPNIGAVRANPLDCTRKSTVLLRAPKVLTPARDGTVSASAPTRENHQPDRPALIVLTPTLAR